MFQITKTEQYKGTLGYLHLTRLNEDNEPLSEKMMLSVFTPDDFDWNNPPEYITDEAVIDLLNDQIDNLVPRWDEDDELTDMAYANLEAQAI